MEKIHIGIIGLIAGGCTTVSFVPQLLKILRTKHARDISLSMYIVLTTGILLWIIYGLLIEELPIILSNAVAFVLCLIIVILKLMFSGKDPGAR